MEAVCSTGRIYFVRELRPDIVTKRSENIVRVTGRLVDHDFSSCLVLIEDPSAKNHLLTVNTAFIEPFHSAGGSLFQFLGELSLNDDSGGLVLQAFVSRCVDGLDMKLYELAVENERRFLTEREKLDQKTMT
ncbi:uncharacterized protein LOC141906817 [Tubulanus polymorphus]|uniref:uncharacterized protein LOC141906817 n=1 Tax=Tubulanus polymorphus TaxID=672921 RepID=UPI003DA395C9